MDRLFVNLSKLLNKKVKLVQYSTLSQNQLNDPDVILWNKESTIISSELYINIKNSLSKRPCKYYLCSSLVSFADFCIAIICCLQYKLNHNTTVNIPETTYRAAWRIIDSQSTIAIDSVKDWINKHIAGRTSKGYCNALGISLTKNTRFVSFNKEEANFEDDNEKILSSISSKPKIVKIKKTQNIELFHTINDVNTIFESTATPDGQLYALINASFYLGVIK